MNNWRALRLVILLGLALILAACQENGSQDMDSNSTPTIPVEEQAPPAAMDIPPLQPTSIPEDLGTPASPPATEPALESNPEGEAVPDTGFDYPNAELLVSVDWLEDQITQAGSASDSGIRILDIRPEAEYLQGHIPGAVNIPVEDIVSSVGGVPFIFDEQSVQEALNRAGLTPDTIAIVYDNLGMMNAARMFWTLEYVGHADARLLNGGWNAWVEQEAEISTQPVEVEKTQYEIDLQPEKLVSAEELLDRLDEPNVVIVDARSPQEYTGEVVFAERGGHIPGAVNLVWLDALTGGDTVYTTEPDWQEQLQDEDVEVFKEAGEIQEMLDDLNLQPEQEVITYCQTHWRGAHVYFLLRLMGFDDVRGYDGSWVEWGNREDLPAVSGLEPGQVEE
jgi:thiosulfate/3-mercaptopyruvate sulfurtransferase